MGPGEDVAGELLLGLGQRVVSLAELPKDLRLEHLALTGLQATLHEAAL